MLAQNLGNPPNPLSTVYRSPSTANRQSRGFIDTRGLWTVNSGQCSRFTTADREPPTKLRSSVDRLLAQNLGNLGNPLPATRRPPHHPPVDRPTVHRLPFTV
ncbi:hypothetical protein RZS08_25225, partial [Arthrospira platensis SPKY1]|nr:hypothetical protein [Arthrospira platensis SPKY1]